MGHDRFGRFCHILSECGVVGVPLLVFFTNSIGEAFDTNCRAAER
jgi:hypothetical protein